MTTDQKRALGIGAIGLVALVALRRRSSGGHLAPPVINQTAPYTPQAPVVLTSGESLYDPNSQNLLNTPTAIPQPQSHSAGSPGYVVNVTYPNKHAHVRHRRKPATRKVAKPAATHKASKTSRKRSKK